MFYNTSDVSSPQVTATWNFGDGGSSIQYDSIAHAFSLGTYEMCITVTSAGCVNTHCEVLDLTDPCLVLQAKYKAQEESGNPLKYQFTDQSTGPIGSHLWGFGDGQISSEANPQHTYTSTGIYTVCLLTMDADGNCTDSDCRSLYVGTTGIDHQGEIPFRKMTAMPNPVSQGEHKLLLQGMDKQDLGFQAEISIMDMHGVVIKHWQAILTESNEVEMPAIPGLYYVQVFSNRNRYGTMIAVQ
jgi:hypothetical protein